jgi:hypothetical protein
MKVSLPHVGLWFVALILGVCLLSGCGQDTPLGLNPTPDPLAASIGLGKHPITPLPTLENQEVVVEMVNPAAELPPCAPKMETTASLPENFAPNFPFPGGIVWERAEALNDNPNYLQVIGYAPLNLQTGINHFMAALPRAGYALGTGDSEQWEAETIFTGNGYRGGLRVVGFPNCEDVTQWTVVMIKR